METKGITSTSYLTRSMLNKLYRKKLTNDELEDLIFSGEIIKKFSYYQASEGLLRKWKIIPPTVGIQKAYYGFIAKKNAFTMQQLMEVFDCNKDTIKLIINKFFQRRNNFFYKNELLSESLLDGDVVFEV